jgi:hypothetical protein
VRLLAAAAIKKLRAQDVSLFCVFNFSFGGWHRGVLCFFNRGPNAKFAFVFSMRLAGQSRDRRGALVRAKEKGRPRSCANAE